MAVVILEDGRTFQGESLGAEGITCGEVVFNTSMCGYQEILTDPSYHGQIINMTYPLIGNYGVNEEDVESARVQSAGFIVKEACPYPSSWRSTMSLEDYLKHHKIVGIKGIDTRALTRHIRQKGAMRGLISSEDLPKAELLARVQQTPSLSGLDLVREVTTDKRYNWSKQGTNYNYKVVVCDYGIKHSILDCLEERGCELTVVPADTSATEIMALKPDGIFLSNGPGDPAAVGYAIETIRELAGKKPMFGICLGHQLMCLALGAKTYKLKFGHRGGNQPVRNPVKGRVEISSQNHGFAVDTDSLRGTGLEVTYINLNDNTVEGVSHKKWPFFSVQYHPEASPGPHDTRHLFDRFIKLMEDHCVSVS